MEQRFANIESRIRAIEERILLPMVTAEPALGSDAELRATVERLTAENASLEVENRTLRGLVRRVKEVLL